jgi:damage-control phosphatase, subfamily I
LKTNFDCYPCFLRQALKAARLSGADEVQQYTVIQQTLALLQTLPLGLTPPEMAHQVYKLIREVLDTQDPYFETKKMNTRQALALYPHMKTLVQNSPDPLDMAIRLSIAGNIIDFAVIDEMNDLWQSVERLIQKPFAIDERNTFKQALQKAGYILYLSDNAGETVFDRVLIETLSVPVVYAVKSKPILNDAILSDALDAGLDTCARLMENGSQSLGTIMSLCSSEFRQHFEQAPLIIAKGQANYETLSEADKRIFCFLQAKCPVIAQDMDVPVGSVILRQCKN